MEKTIKLIQRNALELNQILNLEKNKGGILFKYFVSKNTLTLTKALEAYEAVRVDAVKIRESYDKAIRDEIIIPYTIPQKKQSNVFEFKVSKELEEEKNKELQEKGALSKELSVKIAEYTAHISTIIKAKQAELDEKFKDDLDSYNKKIEALEKILDEEIDVKLRLIELKDLPEDMSSELMDQIVFHDLICEIHSEF